MNVALSQSLKHFSDVHLALHDGVGVLVALQPIHGDHREVNGFSRVCFPRERGQFVAQVSLLTRRYRELALRVLHLADVDDLPRSRCLSIGIRASFAIIC